MKRNKFFYYILNNLVYAEGEDFYTKIDGVTTKVPREDIVDYYVKCLENWRMLSQAPLTVLSLFDLECLKSKYWEGYSNQNRGNRLNAIIDSHRIDLSKAEQIVRVAIKELELDITQKQGQGTKQELIRIIKDGSDLQKQYVFKLIKEGKIPEYIIRDVQFFQCLPGIDVFEAYWNNEIPFSLDGFKLKNLQASDIDRLKAMGVFVDEIDCTKLNALHNCGLITMDFTKELWEQGLIATRDANAILGGSDQVLDLYTRQRSRKKENFFSAYYLMKTYIKVMQMKDYKLMLLKG